MKKIICAGYCKIRYDRVPTAAIVLLEYLIFEFLLNK